MKRKNILFFGLITSLILNIILIYCILKFKFDFSTTEFNNIVSPITTVVAVLFAGFSWLESNKSNNLNLSLTAFNLYKQQVEDIFDEINGTELISRSTNTETYNYVEFKDYKDTLNKTNIELNKNHFEDYLKTNKNKHLDDILTEFHYLPDNQNHYFNNEKISLLIEGIKHLQTEKENILHNFYIKQLDRYILNKIIETFQIHLHPSNMKNLHIYYNNNYSKLNNGKEYEIIPLIKFPQVSEIKKLHDKLSKEIY